LLWQGGADQGACGVAVGEDLGRRLLGAGSRGPSRSMGLLRPDLGPVLAGEGREGRQVGLGVDQHLGDSEGNGSLKVSMTCLYWAATAS